MIMGKMLTRPHVILLLVTASLVVLTPPGLIEAQLVNGFYASHGCPKAESIIKSAVITAIQQNSANAPGLLRIFFHDCIVNGCDGSVLIDSPSEKDAIPNQTLHGFAVIDTAKAQVEEVCPGIVSCADIVALAAETSVSITSGGRVSWEVPTGRRDGLVSSAAAALAAIPRPTDTVATITSKFAARGLSVEQMVALSGAHTIGLAHCSAFSNRLSPTLDSTLASPLAQSLLTLCPSGSNNTTNLDVTTPTKFDAAYFRNLQVGLGLLTSDAELQSDGSTSGFVSANTNFNTFAANFISSMIAMGNVEVLTGTAGQIRTNCHAFNS
ncbi:hypothetical protein CY35_10G099600 [Sphagnum magellanicum]|nr:hypothetical protein CY35_10G099600 [Sphagnum magellanicum]